MEIIIKISSIIFHFPPYVFVGNNNCIKVRAIGIGKASRLHREGREFEYLTAHQTTRVCSAWLERLPVTQEAAGSSPSSRQIADKH